MRSRLQRYRRHGATQILLYVSAYLAYLWCRGLAAGGPAQALANAHSLYRLEVQLHINIERALQQPFLHTWTLWWFNHIYLLTQFGVVPLTLFMLYQLARPAYRRLRNILLGSWMMALPIYAAYPVAPPRLSVAGVADTISSGQVVQLNSHALTSFYDLYAAMPSMHVGFAFAVSISVFVALPPYRGLRYIVLLWGPLVALTVIVTGNHFVLDGVAGILVVALAWAFDRYALPLLRAKTVTTR